MRLIRSTLETWLLFLKVHMVDEKNIAFVINTYIPMTMSASGVAQQSVGIRSVFVYEGEGKKGRRISAVVFVARLMELFAVRHSVQACRHGRVPNNLRVHEWKLHCCICARCVVPVAICRFLEINSSDVRLATSVAEQIRHCYFGSWLDLCRLVHLCTTAAPIGRATRFSSRSLSHQRSHIGSYMFCIREVSTWRRS